MVLAKFDPKRRQAQCSVTSEEAAVCTGAQRARAVQARVTVVDVRARRGDTLENTAHQLAMHGRQSVH